LCVGCVRDIVTEDLCTEASDWLSKGHAHKVSTADWSAKMRTVTNQNAKLQKRVQNLFQRVNLCPHTRGNYSRAHTHTHIHTLTRIHAYTHIRTYTDTHTCTHMHTCTHTHIHTHIRTYTPTHMHTHAHTCTRTHMHTHTYTHAHTRTHTHTHIHTHTHTYIHIHTRTPGVNRTLLTMLAPPFHGTTALFALVMSHPGVATLCRGSSYQCEGNRRG